MPWTGLPLQPRDVAMLCAGYWKNEDLVLAVAVCLSESGGYPHAWHDNGDADGNLKSRDVGLFQINIPAVSVGTQTETDLYDPVKNVARAWSLYQARGWQPWYGYTNGYATSKEWWHQAADGTWHPTGRYLMRAARGVGNFLARKVGLETPFLDYRSVPPHP